MTQHTQDQHSEMWLEDGIIHIFYKPGLIIDLEIAQKMIAQRISLSQGGTYPLMSDIRGLQAIDKASRKLFASPEATYLISAGALYLDTPIISWAANVFTHIDRPLCPIRQFTDREKALTWLRSYKNVPAF